MRGAGGRGAFGVTVALALLLALSTSPAWAAGPCELHVDPRSGAAGTVFRLIGAGYSPTTLVLQKDGEEPVRIPLAPPATDSFEIPISSRTGDEGGWTATAIDDAASCAAEVRFRVTLLDTAAATSAPPPGGGPALPAVMYLLVIAAGFAGGARLARVARTG